MKRSRIRRVSRKRAGQATLRSACREIVLARDRLCRGLGLTPVDCRRIPSEVHELGRGAYRSACWLDPELCIGLCSPCHRWITEHPIEAQELKLALPGWRIEQLLKEPRH